MNKGKKKIALAAAVGVSSLMFLGRFATRTNVAQTSATHDDPQLRTRHYDASAEQVAATVRSTVPNLSTYGRSWRVVSSRSHGGALVVACEVPVLIFADDLVVEMRQEGTSTTLNIRSASRVGKGDFGENRRHVLQILDYLDKALPQSNFARVQ